MFVRTERLFLRPCWPDDLNELMAAFREESVQRAFASSALPTSRDAMRRYLEQPRNPRLPHFCMYLRGARGARLVGWIGLAMDGDRVQVGYWIAHDYRGKGYALEALRAVVEQARALGYRQLFANHCAVDDASVRVLEAAGFREMEIADSSGSRSATAKRLYVADLARCRSDAPSPKSEALSA